MKRSLPIAWLVGAVVVPVATASSNSDRLQVYDYVRSTFTTGKIIKHIRRAPLL